MGIIQKTTKVLNKTADKAIKTATGTVSKTIDTAKNAVFEQIEKTKRDDEYLYELVLPQQPNSDKNEFKIFDGKENVVYKVKGAPFDPTWTLEISDPSGLILGKLHKKVISIRSPLKRYEGDNYEFEVVINRNKLGSLKNKELGSLFDGISKRVKDFKSYLKGSHYEYDFIDMEIVAKGFIFGYEIRNKDGAILSKSKQSRGHYTIRHSNKEEELLYLMMILAMDFIEEDQLRKNMKRWG